CDPKKLGLWLQKRMKTHEISIEKPFNDNEHVSVRVVNDSRNYEQVISKFFDEIQPGTLLLVILPSSDNELYSTLKRVGDIGGVLTVCCQNDKYDTETTEVKLHNGNIISRNPELDLGQKLSNL